MIANNKPSLSKAQEYPVIAALTQIKSQLAWFMLTGLLLVVAVSFSHLAIIAQLALLLSYMLFACGWVIWRVWTLKRYWYQQRRLKDEF